MGCIYYHKNKINGHMYIGQSVSNSNKINSNRWRDGKGYRDQTKFAKAIKEFGWENFEHNILEDRIPREMLNDREKYWIKHYDTFRNGYNSNSGGSGIYGSFKKWEENIIYKYYAIEGAEKCCARINAIWKIKPFPQYFKSARAISYKARSQGIFKDYRVICIETGEIYKNPLALVTLLGLKSSGDVCLACVGRKDTFAGMHLAYAYDTNRIKALEKFKGQPLSNAFWQTRHVKVFCAEDNMVYESMGKMIKAGIASRALVYKLKNGESYYKGKHYAFADDTAAIEKIKQYIGKKAEIINPGRRKAIYCLELDTEYSGLIAAQKLTGINNITKALITGQLIGGYHWCYLKDKQKLIEQFPELCNSKKKQDGCRKKVRCIELNMVFESAKQAGDYFGIYNGCIIGCCRHRAHCHTAGGYHWEYVLD